MFRAQWVELVTFGCCCCHVKVYDILVLGVTWEAYRRFYEGGSWSFFSPEMYGQGGFSSLLNWFLLLFLLFFWARRYMGITHSVNVELGLIGQLKGTCDPSTVASKRVSLIWKIVIFFQTYLTAS